MRNTASTMCRHQKLYYRARDAPGIKPKAFLVFHQKLGSRCMPARMVCRLHTTATSMLLQAKKLSSPPANRWGSDSSWNTTSGFEDPVSRYSCWLIAVWSFSVCKGIEASQISGRVWATWYRDIWHDKVDLCRAPPMDRSWNLYFCFWCAELLKVWATWCCRTKPGSGILNTWLKMYIHFERSGFHEVRWLFRSAPKPTRSCSKENINSNIRAWVDPGHA